MNLPSRVSSPSHVVFFFDFLDPHAYLAATQIPRICREVQASLTLEPVDSRLIDGDERHRADRLGPEVQTYLWESSRIAAKRLGVSFNTPVRFPFDSSRALRTCLFVRDRSGQEAMAAVVESLWNAIWVEGADPEDVATAVAIGRGVAVPERAMREGLEDPRIPEMLARVSARAFGRGVQRVPAVLVDGSLFQGLDDVLAAESVIRETDSASPAKRDGGSGDDQDPDDLSVPDWTFSG